MKTQRLSMLHRGGSAASALGHRTVLLSLQRAAVTAAVLGLSASHLSCAKGFDAESLVQGVRVLSSRADKPYAKPGEDVTVSLLVADERTDRTVPLAVGFLPVNCMNPRDDLYFACFLPGQAPAAPAPGAPAGGGLSALKPGQDLTNFLSKGDSYKFKMPDDAVIARPKEKTPYGVAIVFWVACAGRVVFDGIDPAAPAGIPLGCIANGERVPQSNFVFGLTRVYSYTERGNTNPTITELQLDGKAFDPKVGIDLEACDKDDLPNCKEHKLDIVVPPTDQEQNNAEVDINGKPLRELIWAGYFGSVGAFGSEARLLFDPSSGAVPEAANKVYGAGKPGEAGRGWVVVHDNRGGANWQEFPIRIK
jgi:hypothetical protein